MSPRPSVTHHASPHYLVKYKFSEIAPTESQQRQTERERTKEHLIIVDELALSQ